MGSKFKLDDSDFEHLLGIEEEDAEYMKSLFVQKEKQQLQKDSKKTAQIISTPSPTNLLDDQKSPSDLQFKRQISTVSNGVQPTVSNGVQNTAKNAPTVSNGVQPTVSNGVQNFVGWWRPAAYVVLDYFHKNQPDNKPIPTNNFIISKATYLAQETAKHAVRALTINGFISGRLIKTGRYNASFERTLTPLGAELLKTEIAKNAIKNHWESTVSNGVQRCPVNGVQRRMIDRKIDILSIGHEFKQIDWSRIPGGSLDLAVEYYSKWSNETGKFFDALFLSSQIDIFVHRTQNPEFLKKLGIPIAVFFKELFSVTGVLKTGDYLAQELVLDSRNRQKENLIRVEDEKKREEAEKVRKEMAIKDLTDSLTYDQKQKLIQQQKEKYKKLPMALAEDVLLSIALSEQTMSDTSETGTTS